MDFNNLQKHILQLNVDELISLRDVIDEKIKELTGDIFSVSINLIKHKIKKTSKCWLATGNFDGSSLKNKKFIDADSWDNSDSVTMKGIFIMKKPGHYEFNQAGYTKKDETGIFELDEDGFLHHISGDYPPEPIE